MDSKDLQSLIKFVAKSGVSEVKYKTKDFEIYIKTPLAGNDITYTTQPAIHHAPATAVPTPQTIASTAQNPPAPAADDNKNYVEIKSPMIGTFYRKPSPDKDVFVNVGDDITSGTVVCVIEAMKLFNQIESEVKGKIVKVLVDDASPVEYDQPLFLVDPS